MFRRRWVVEEEIGGVEEEIGGGGGEKIEVAECLGGGDG